MFWGWWDHTFYVYQLCTWLCMCTTSYVQKCAEIVHVSISAFHGVRRRTIVRHRAWCECDRYFARVRLERLRRTSYDHVRCRTTSYVVVLIEHVQNIGFVGIHTTCDVVRRRIRRETQHFCAYDVVQRRTMSYVPAHTQPRTQLVDVKCVVPPSPEHSQTALLTSESICGSCHCIAEVIVRV